MRSSKSVAHEKKGDGLAQIPPTKNARCHYPHETKGLTEGAVALDAELDFAFHELHELVVALDHGVFFLLQEIHLRRNKKKDEKASSCYFNDATKKKDTCISLRGKNRANPSHVFRLRPEGITFGYVPRMTKWVPHSAQNLVPTDKTELIWRSG
jgi:hypothetical protein